MVLTVPCGADFSISISDMPASLHKTMPGRLFHLVGPVDDRENGHLTSAQLFLRDRVEVDVDGLALNQRLSFDGTAVDANCDVPVGEQMRCQPRG